MSVPPIPAEERDALPCPRCQCQPRLRRTRDSDTLVELACPNGCMAVTNQTIADWNDLVRTRRLLADMRRIANHCKNETQIPDVDGPTTFELAWDVIQSYQVRIVWWHHDGGIDENDAAGATPEEAIGHLAAQLKRSVT